jgi:hypothetical protein
LFSRDGPSRRASAYALDDPQNRPGTVTPHFSPRQIGGVHRRVDGKV